jgi:uroporphyrinogen decarboxylase
MAEFHAFPWPRAGDFPYEPFELAARDLPGGMRVSVHMGWNFTGAWWLAGMERFLTGMIDQPELCAALVDRIGVLQHECLLRVLDEHRAVVGVVTLLDDLAHLGGLLVSPDFLRQHVFPWYRETCLACHRAELPVVFHSDGDLTEVMPDLVACGFDALHPIEPQAMDIRAVKREYGDRLCLLGNIDLAYPLGLGTPDDVREAVRSLIADCAAGGGLGVGSGNTVPEYVPFENWTALREATLEFGRYPIQA